MKDTQRYACRSYIVGDLEAHPGTEDPGAEASQS
jgi:hypothetical protein